SNLASHMETTELTQPKYIEEAFGKDETELKAASPLYFTRSGLPPFLVLVAEDDPKGLREQGKKFADALREAGNDARFVSIKGRDHFSIVRRFGPSDDVTANGIAQFIDVVSRRQQKQTEEEEGSRENEAA